MRRATAARHRPSCGQIGRMHAWRIFQKINDEGGINGRKIKLSLDDGYSPPKTLEMTGEGWSNKTKCCSSIQSWAHRRFQPGGT